MSRSALDRIMQIMACGVVGSVLLSLAAMLVLAVTQDGALAAQAMQSFQAVAQWALVGGGLWGMAHTIVTTVRPSGGPDAPSAPASGTASAATAEPAAPQALRTVA